VQRDPNHSIHPRDAKSMRGVSLGLGVEVLSEIYEEAQRGEDQTSRARIKIINVPKRVKA
jgi:hypothetical protein